MRETFEEHRAVGRLDETLMEFDLCPPIGQRPCRRGVKATGDLEQRVFPAADGVACVGPGRLDFDRLPEPKSPERVPRSDQLVGKDANGLSPNVVVRLEQKRGQEYEEWSRRDLSGEEDVSIRADGVLQNAA